MSVHVSSCVWKHAAAKGNPLLVMLALADTAQDDGTCWPGFDYIAAKTRLSRSTVIRCIARLEEAGALIRMERPGTSNVYRVVVCEGCQIDTPKGRGRGVNPTGRGVSTDTGGVSLLTPEPSMNHQENRESAERAPRRRRPETPLPADWKPKQAHAEYASQRNLDLSSEAFRFRAHADANDRRQRDWDAAFRLWLSKAHPVEAPQRRSAWDRAQRMGDDR